MNDVAIRVDGLGKRYRLRQSADGRPGYRTLREEVGRWPGRLWSALGSAAVEEEFWALRDVSFEVRRGEVLGVIGRNGAGKSTLLKILSRIAEPSEGAVDLYGRVGSLLEVGTGFHPELTGRENIYLSGAMLGMRRHEVRRRFDEIVAFAGTEKFIDTPCKHYSSGMYARLGFAVAAHLDTDILLIDEVLAVGDALFQQRCLDRMRAVASQGRTVLFVSHNLAAVRHFCTAALTLDGGNAHWWGNRVDEAISAYLSSHGAGASEWRGNDARATNNRWFALEALRLVDPQGRTIAGPISGNAGVRIEITGSVNELHPALCVGFALYGEDETALLWSYQNDPDEARRPVLEKGRQVLWAHLPASWLNEGRHRIEFLCGLHCMEWIVAPRSNGPSVCFEVRGVAGSSAFRLQRRPVLLAPVLDWQHAPVPTGALFASPSPPGAPR